MLFPEGMVSVRLYVGRVPGSIPINFNYLLIQIGSLLPNVSISEKGSLN